MAKQTSITKKEDVERQLREAAGQVEARVAALQEEVATIGPALRKALFEHPLFSVGGALLAGLAVGLLFGGRKRPADPFGGQASHRALVEGYLDAVMAEARHRLAQGAEAGEAVREALADRVPLIVYEPGEAAGRSGSLLRQVLDVTLKTALGFGIKVGFDFLTKSIDLPDFLDEEAAEGAASDAGEAAALSEAVEG